MPEIKTSVSSQVFYHKMGSGPAMVLLHGFPECCSLWRNVWDELSRSFTLIIPDMPGIGRTVLSGPTSLSRMAEMVSEIMDYEGIATAVVAGHSMGGYISLAFARAFPHKVAGIALVHSMSDADDAEKRKLRSKTIELVKKGGKELFMKEMVPNLFADSFRSANPLVISEQVAEAIKMDAESVINFYTAIRERDDNRPVLNSAAYPVMWVAGLQDNVIDYKKILPECYRSAVNFVSFYSDCGHMSMIEAPTELINDLEQFGQYCYHKYSTGA